MKKKVIAAGHICLDITPVFPNKKVHQVSDILLPGKLIQVNKADVHTGGSVANTGLAMKILGADVTLMGKVGKDTFGDMICNILKKYDADKGMICMEGEETSYSVVLAIPGTDRIFLHNPGANDTFSSEDIPDIVLQEAALLHFGYPPLMKKMYQNGGDELLSLMKRAKKLGCITSLDMAAIDSDTEAGQLDWNQILKGVLPYVDIFVPSVEEICYMLDRERFKNWQERAAGKDITEILDVEKDIKPLAECCMQYGVKILLIKCGVPGIYYRTAESKLLRELDLNVDDWAQKEGFEKSYVPERVLSATGAGDTSIAAFLTAMLEGYSLEETMRLTTATGACCVTSYDALSGLQPFSVLKEKIDAGWKKRE